MKFITISKARANLSEFVRSVEAGEKVIVTQRGVPAMKVVRPDVPGQRRVGLDAGAFTVPDTFDDPISWAAPYSSNP
jgi:antitoxin (DNA-binding transcriptional repressor) of toxin-antitoxin stability system